MVVELLKEYDYLLEDVRRGNRELDQDYQLKGLARQLIYDCCETINKNKNIALDFFIVGFLYDPVEMCIKASTLFYLINNSKTTQIGGLHIKLPFSSDTFCRDHLDWYKNTIQDIWDLYKKWGGLNKC